jgi:hypothetical protein
MADKVQKIGEMRFCLDDWRETKYNESTDTTFALYGAEDDEVMSLETYYLYCRQFAAAMGFSEKSIEERFGKY